MSSLKEKALKSMEINKSVEFKDLKPPMAPKKNVVETENLETMVRKIVGEEFSRLVEENLNNFIGSSDDSSDDLRFRYKKFTGKTIRGSNKVIVNELEKYFTNVIKDLKENFKNGNLKPSQIK